MTRVASVRACHVVADVVVVVVDDDDDDEYGSHETLSLSLSLSLSFSFSLFINSMDPGKNGHPKHLSRI